MNAVLNYKIEWQCRLMTRVSTEEFTYAVETCSGILVKSETSTIKDDLFNSRHQEVTI